MSVLAMVMIVLSPLPMAAQFSGSGTGSQNDPYLIMSPTHLNQMRNNPAACYKLYKDVDITSWLASSGKGDWEAFDFSGTFDGNGKTILGMKGNGFFSTLSGTVENLTLSGVYGADRAGGAPLAINAYGATVSQVTIISTAKMVDCKGGVVASSSYSTFTDVTVTLPEVSTQYSFGGIVGTSIYDVIKNSSVTCDDLCAGSNVGGIVGLSQITTDITGCTVKGKIHGLSNVGGIAGVIHSMPNYKLTGNHVRASVQASGSKVGGVIGLADFLGPLGSSDKKVYTSCSGNRYDNIQLSSDELNDIRKYVPRFPEKFSLNCGQYFDAGDVLITDYVSFMPPSDSVYKYELEAYFYYNKGYTCVRSLTLYITSKSDDRSTVGQNSFVGNVVSQNGNSVGGIMGYGISTVLNDNEFSGTVCGIDTVAGIANGPGNTITNCVSIGRIDGQRYVNGLSNGTNATNCAAINSLVRGQSGVARASGKNNIALATTKVIENGADISRRNSDADGTSFSLDDAQLKTSYQAYGFDFTSVWTNIETESFPYINGMAAPPTIQTDVVAGMMQAQGRSINGGIVEVTMAGEVVNALPVGTNSWRATVSPMQAGDVLMVRANTDNMPGSYYAMQTIAYKGEGTADSPYLVSSARDLQNVYGNHYYKLTRDLDLKDYGYWTPIVLDGATFDGGGFTISNLKVKGNDTAAVGLFSVVQNGTIKNLKLSQCSVVGTGIATGGLVGNLKGGTINNCLVEGSVTGHANTGSVVGKLEDGTLSESTSTANVSSDGDNIGGVVGYNGGTVIDCNYNGSITPQNAQSLCGGIAGLNYGTIKNSYYSGNISGEARWAAGIAGCNDGAAAQVLRCVASSQSIILSNSDGVTMRIYSGCRNGAELGDEKDNLASVSMQLSVNDIPYESDDDPLNGTAVGEDMLKKGDTYSSLGWDMSKCWSIDEGYSMPFHSALGGSLTTSGDAFSIYADSSMVYCGEDVRIPVMMTNIEDISSCQFDLVIPDGFTIAQDEYGDDLVELGNRTSARKHAISHQLNGNALRVIIVSPTLKTFAGNEGEICAVTLHAADSLKNGNYTFLINGSLGTPLDCRSVYSRPASFDVQVVSDAMACDSVTSINYQTQTLEISLANHTSVVSYQMDVALPDGMDIPKDEDGNYMISHADRTNPQKFAISSKKMDNGLIRILCVSPENTPISGNEGTLLTFPVTFDKSMEAGDYEVGFSNVNLCETNFHSIAVPDFIVKATLELRENIVKGDVNKDKNINTSDVQGIYAFIQNYDTSKFNLWAADMNDDNEISVADATILTNFILSGNKFSVPVRRLAPRSGEYQGPELYIEPFTVEPGQEVEVNINLSNPDNEVGGMQFDLYIPDGLKPVVYEDEDPNDYTQIEINNSARGKGFFYTSSRQKNGCYRFAGNDFSNKSYRDSDGAIFSIRLKADENFPAGVVTATMNHMELAFKDQNQWKQPEYNFTILSGNLAGVDSIDFQGRLTDNGVAPINTILSTAVDAAYLDAQSANLTALTVPFALGNPNGLVLYAADAAVNSSITNAVKDFVCEKLELVDGYNFGSPEVFTAQSVTYRRDGIVPGKFCAGLLPFKPEAGDMMTFAFDGMTDDGTAMFSEGLAEANVPFLFKVSDGSTVTFSAVNALIEPTTRATYGDSDFVGVFTKTTMDNCYDIDGNEVSGLMPFYAYLYSLSGFQGIEVGGVAVGIDGMGADEANHDIYTLQGMRLDGKVKNLPAGVYIIDGKKVMVRSSIR